MKRSAESFEARFTSALLLAALVGGGVVVVFFALGLASAFLVGGDGSALLPARVMFFLMDTPEKLLGVRGNPIVMGSIFWGVVSGVSTFVIWLFPRNRLRSFLLRDRARAKSDDFTNPFG